MRDSSAGFSSSQDLLMQQQLTTKGNLGLKGLFMSWFVKALLGYSRNFCQQLRSAFLCGLFQFLCTAVYTICWSSWGVTWQQQVHSLGGSSTAGKRVSSWYTENKNRAFALISTEHYFRLEVMNFGISNLPVILLLYDILIVIWLITGMGWVKVLLFYCIFLCLILAVEKVNQ